jgi:hypothetical protein
MALVSIDDRELVRVFKMLHSYEHLTGTLLERIEELHQRVRNILNPDLCTRCHDELRVGSKFCRDCIRLATNERQVKASRKRAIGKVIKIAS